MSSSRYNYVARERTFCAWTGERIDAGDRCFRDERTGAVFLSRREAKAAGCA